MQEPITEAQLVVLRIIATGATNAEAAQRLSLSVKTIESHVAEMLERSGTRNRLQLTVLALRQGLIKLEELGDVEQSNRFK